MNRVAAWLESKLVSRLSPNRFLPIQLDITNTCNLKCDHCYHPDHNNTGAISTADWFKIIDQYVELLERINYRPFAMVCGGEPLISHNLQPILDRLAQVPRMRLAVLTNGIFSNRLKAHYLTRFEKVDVQVSFDGPESGAHDRVRGLGAFDRAVAGVQDLNSRGFSVHILAVLSRRNAQLIPDFFRLARSIGAVGVSFTRLIGLGQASELIRSGEDLPLAANELRIAYGKILVAAADYGIHTNLDGPLFHLIHPALGGSGLFGEGLVVDYQGRLLASSRSRLELGSALEDGLEKTFFNHPIYRALRAGNVEVCGSCKFYQSCGGDRNAAFADSGNYLGPDPGCWYIAGKTDLEER